MAASIEAAFEAIERFLASASRPVLLEAGEAEIPIVEGSYSLDRKGSGLRISAWTDSRNYSRRVVGLRKVLPGRVELTITKLGRVEGTLTLVDTGYQGNAGVRKRGQREHFREEFRLMLARQYPDWKLVELTTGPDLEHSLSPSYPRALLRQGTMAVAAIASGPEALNPDGALTFGLIWLDYLRRRERQLTVGTLTIFLPEQAARSTALRLVWLDETRVACRLFVFRPGGEFEADPKDLGNLQTRLGPPTTSDAPGAGPEAELERVVMHNIGALDARLMRAPVYRQAPAIAGSDRGIADLVAMDIESRLAVMELKASQDIHLPLQALDYWTRVKWHVDHGDFSRLGYFPGREIRTSDPVLYLVAPAFEFHPAVETVMRFFDPRIQITRLGVSANWRKELKVISREDNR